ncbi:MAG TPA: hypothetical protein VMO47_16325 [Rhodothermales bacterium]|nr:hypothetical protein [Rhodothermales bacterium]
MRCSRESLKIEHVMPRLLGHWGATPGLNTIYVHLNRCVVERDLDMIYVTGPGHDGPAWVACTWLEGSYSDLYDEVFQDEDGMARLFQQFSFPGGIPSHCAPETPGSRRAANSAMRWPTRRSGGRLGFSGGSML